MTQRLMIAVLSIAAFAAGFGLLHTAHTSAQTPSGVAADYIVVLRDTTPDTDAEVDRIERLQTFRSRFRYRAAIQGFSARLTPLQAEFIRRLPAVAYVTLDAEVHITDWVPLLTGDTTPPGIRRIEAAVGNTVRQASTVNVAVIDTGVAPHPDLLVTPGINCTAEASTVDLNGHGTHVAGTIAAMNNGSGVVGVAPGTRIYAVKVFDAQGKGTWSEVMCGMDWVTQNAAALNIKVANMSLGGPGSTDAYCGSWNYHPVHQAVCRMRDAGVTVVVAAGNNGADLASTIPASYPEVLTVTAMSDSDGLGGARNGSPGCWAGFPDDSPASFSNYAVSAADSNHTLAAPGVCVNSTYLNNGYMGLSGTSMATPHVAGSVALCFGDGGAAGPCTGLTPDQIIQKMRSDAAARSSTPGYGFQGDPNNPVAGKYYGYLVTNALPAAPPDFSVMVSPTSRKAIQGTTASYTVTVVGVNGFTSPVNLSVSGAPANSTASFTPSSVTPTPGGATSTLTVATTVATPPGTYTLTVTGADGTRSRAAPMTLVVGPPDFTFSVSPATSVVSAGSSTAYTLSLGSASTYNVPVNLSVSGAPANSTVSFTQSRVTPIPGGVTSTLTVATTATTPAGSYTLIVVAADSAQSRATYVTLVVTAPDFTISASPATRTVNQGSNTTYTLNLTSVNGYSTPVALSVSGAPASTTASYTPSSVTPTAGGVTSTLTVATSATTPAGTYTLTVTGTDGTRSHTATVTLVVTAADFTISAAPTSRAVNPGTSAAYTVTLAALNGYNLPVNLSVSGAPGNSTVGFTLSSVTPTSGGATSTLTVATTASTPPGTYTLTVTGADGTRSRAATVTLVVSAGDFTISAAPTTSIVNRGSNATYTLNLTSVNGYGTSVSLSLSALPANTTATFSTSSRTPTAAGAPVTLTVFTTSSTPVGSFPLTVTGSDGTLVHAVALTLTVNPAPVGDFTITVSPTASYLWRGGSATLTVKLTTANGYNLPVTLSVTGAGTVMTSTFTPTSVTPTAGGATSTWRIAANNAASTGIRTATVRAVGSDGMVRTVNVSLSVLW